MKKLYGLLALIVGFTMGFTQAATDKIVAGGSDFDDVITLSTSTMKYMWSTARAIGIKNTARGLKKVWSDKSARDVVKAAVNKALRYADGRKVIGAAGYMELITQNVLPFLSENEKQRLLELAWEVKPNVALIEFYQSLQAQGIPVYVWTDNDQVGYDKKLAILNGELIKLGKKPFMPDGVQCAVGNTPTDPGLSKDHAKYFKEAYQAIQSKYPALGTSPKILFIDDKLKNVKNAESAAETEKINIVAFQYKGTKNDLDQIKSMFS